MTGADSPVMADSSTDGDALDDVAVAGDELAGVDDAAGRRSAAAVDGTSVDRCRRAARTWATVSERVLRSVSAWALPRPSATASAKLANSTVNHSQSATSPAKHVVGGVAGREVAEEQDGGEHAADLDDEHDRVAGHLRGGRA